MELQTREAVIVAARRTPIGKMGGKLSRVEPEVLAAEVIKSILKETQLSPLDIDEVILGNAAVRAETSRVWHGCKPVCRSMCPL